MDIDLGDVQPAVAENGGGGFKVGNGFHHRSGSVTNSQFLRLVSSIVRLIVSMNEGPRELL